jgi:hypothetical protein
MECVRVRQKELEVIRFSFLILPSERHGGSFFGR